MGFFNKKKTTDIRIGIRKSKEMKEKLNKAFEEKPKSRIELAKGRIQKISSLGGGMLTALAGTPTKKNKKSNPFDFKI